MRKPWARSQRLLRAESLYFASEAPGGYPGACWALIHALINLAAATGAAGFGPIGWPRSVTLVTARATGDKIVVRIRM